MSAWASKEKWFDSWKQEGVL